jgi:hypothetical protein
MAAGAEARDGEDLASSLNDGSALSLQPIATDAMELERVAVIAQASERARPARPVGLRPIEYREYHKDRTAPKGAGIPYPYLHRSADRSDRATARKGMADGREYSRG